MNTENTNIILQNIQTDYNFRFKNHTTYGLGGSVKAAYFPKTEEEVKAVFDNIKIQNEKFTVLGNGSNILAADNFYNGSVICTKYLSGIKFTDNMIEVESGVTVAELLKFCLKNNVGGFEYLAGIPATIGGLAVMNGGISTRHIGEDIKKVRLYDGKIKEFSNKYCNFGNKHSIMRDINCVVLSVFLSFFAVPREVTEEKIKNILKNRSHLPKGKSCGCVFKNPQEISAGELIEKAGLKGLKCGSAQISSKHANFIINYGNNAFDVYSLIKLVKDNIYKIFGIMLEEEVIYIGEFNEINS